VVVHEPPPSLLEPCPVPQFVGSHNGDLLTYVRELFEALTACNDDKAALRKWRDDKQR
jgi:hypothetical protein